MSLSKLTSKYQVALPSDIRAILGVKAGDRVEFMIEHDQVLIKKPNPIDWMYLESLEYGLNEWVSESDYKAYDHYHPLEL